MKKERGEGGQAKAPFRKKRALEESEGVGPGEGLSRGPIPHPPGER